MKQGAYKAVCLAAVMLFAGCVKDKPGLAAAGDVQVKMSLNVPGTMATRSLSATQQQAVNTIEILVFDKELELVDRQPGYLQNDGGDVSFSAVLKASKNDADVFHLMVLANVYATTSVLFAGDDLGGHKGEDYLTIGQLLEAAVPTYSHISQHGLPMWGELESAVKLEVNAANEYDVDLLHSLARIDVGTSLQTPAAIGEFTDWEALPNFSLEGVLVYNASSRYVLCPASYDFTAKAVTAYTLPAANAKMAAPLHYSDDRQGVGTLTRDGGKGIALTGSVYAGEANVKMGGTSGDAHHAERMTLVVAGRYSADTTHPNTTGDLSYYRLDFTEGANGSALMDILRNKAYQIIITSCSGPGKPTPEEALETIKADMTALIKTWDVGGEGDYEFDGQYLLKVNRSLFEFYDQVALSQTFDITTDYPTGWTIADIRYLPGSTGWITSLTSLTAGGAGSTSLDLDVTTNTGDARSAEITLAAGNMRKKITITQREYNPGVRNIGTDPGVIGYVFNPGKPDHHQLTMVKDDGNDADGIVYVAYFPFGSLIATTSQGLKNATAFTPPKSVIAWPEEWAADKEAMLAKFTSGATSTTNWSEVPRADKVYAFTGAGEFPSATYPADSTKGVGDPCSYYFGSGWKTPSYAEWQAFVGTTSTAANHSDYFSYSITGTPSVTNLGIGMFPKADSVTLPAAGYYNSASFAYRGDIGYYWASSLSGASGRFLAFGNNQFSSGTSTMSFGRAIRCTRPYRVVQALAVSNGSAKVTQKGGTTAISVAMAGDEVTFTATGNPAAAYVFDSWTTTDVALTEVQSKTNPLTITMLDNDVTLTASLRIAAARSNGSDNALVINYIYNPGKPDHYSLTLDPDDGDDTNGITYVALFRFGSLVALSSEAYVSGVNSTFIADEATVVRWPAAWAATRAEMEAKFSGLTAGSATYKAILRPQDVYNPMAPVSPFPSATYPADSTQAIGDACTYYFGSSYRRPTRLEWIDLFGGASTNSSGSAGYTWNPPADGKAATATNPGSGTFPLAPGGPVTLPAGGFRGAAGATSSMGRNGSYWPSEGGSQGLNIGFSSNATSIGQNDQSSAQAIRCVRIP